MHSAKDADDIARAGSEHPREEGDLPRNTSEEDAIKPVTLESICTCATNGLDEATDLYCECARKVHFVHPDIHEYTNESTEHSDGPGNSHRAGCNG